MGKKKETESTKKTHTAQQGEVKKRKNTRKRDVDGRAVKGEARRRTKGPLGGHEGTRDKRKIGRKRLGQKRR